jgi:ABC-2 type transport system ATP-binding protein
MEPIITIRNLTKSYGDKRVLSDINLDIFPGQIIGYIGPNGAGKSTTVKILAGILTGYEGDVTIGAKLLRDNVSYIKSITGYVPELAELYDLLTPNEYLHFIGKLHHMPDALIEERSIRMLRSFGLLEQMHQRMDSFSKGMRQKVLLSAGLIHNPQIVILDEPLSGLDANAVIMVKELLQVLKTEGKTIFYCSHMMDVVEKVSDRIVLLDQGRIIADGTFDQLRGEGNLSLEQIFAQLTRSEEASSQASELMAALNS